MPKVSFSKRETPARFERDSLEAELRVRALAFRCSAQAAPRGF